MENIVRKDKVKDYITTLNNLRENNFLNGFIWLKTQPLFVLFAKEINERYIVKNITEGYHWKEFTDNFLYKNPTTQQITRLKPTKLSQIHSENQNKTFIQGQEELFGLFA